MVSAATGVLVTFLTLLLFGMILLYNFLAKKNPITGPITMGLCRGISVLIGAIAAADLGGKPYIFPPPAFNFDPPIFAAALITAYITLVTILARSESRNPRIPPLIGSLIRGLLFIQAAFCFLAGGAGRIAAIVLLALWPLSRIVANRFYAS
jgi:4-hydroxybenzoate polyprenyltransferase